MEKEQKKYEISVVVVTYNPDFKKLFQTLYSIVTQKDIKQEIIIADDGTVAFDSKRVEKWFFDNEFHEYTLILNKENKGTVSNVYSALKKINGKYVKTISPGDYIYDNMTLRSFVDYMDKTETYLVFGNAVYFSSDEKIQTYKQMAPQDLRPYDKNDIKAIQRNYLFYRDYVVGAAFIIDTDLLLKYVKKIVGKIKYAEDCAIIMMIADGYELKCYNKYLLWYEYGSGISTMKSSIWEERLYQDNKLCFEMIKNAKPQWETAYNMYYGKRNTQCIYWLIRRKIHDFLLKIRKRGKNKEIDISCLENILSIK